jgi:hypothetical protein
MPWTPRGLARTCAHCGQRGAGALVLTCVRNVYAYQWLCGRCAAKVAAAKDRA